MRKKMRLAGVFFSAILMLGIGEVTAQDIIAFPGAEGYGRFASGGRGSANNPGQVAIVKNLLDDAANPPEGSFRWALQQAIVDTTINGFPITLKKPLTIVFQVGGVINLEDELRVSRNNLTIAGQTALGDGICFRGATLNFGGSKNLIVRHIRSRPGDERNAEVSAFRIENGGNFIIDHCSFSWAIEETTHFSSNENTTVQYCILSEALYNSIHKKGERGYAAQWGGEFASYHHNLLAHNNSRNPRINGSNSNDVLSLVDYRNNVNYNWGTSGAFYGGEWEGTPGCIGYSHVNVVHNYFKPGPATSGTTFASPSLNRNAVPLCGYAKWYVDGNIMVGNTDKTENNWLGISFSPKDSIIATEIHVQSDGELEKYDRYTQSAEMAYDSVLANVGATLPKRDAIDERVIGELNGEVAIVRYQKDINGQTTPAKGVNSGIIDTQQNLVPNDAPAGTTAWDVYSTTSSDLAPIDADKDGIPDDWENANGLNPNLNSDGRQFHSSGYINLEIYLNELAGTPIVTSAKRVVREFNFELAARDGSLYYKANNRVQSLELFDVMGKRLKRYFPSDYSGHVSLDTLKTGIYIVKASVENQGDVVKKIMVQ